MNLIEVADRATDTTPLSKANGNGQLQAIDAKYIPHHIHPSISSVSNNTKLLAGFTQLVLDRVNAGWSCHLATFLFSQLSGPKPIVIDRMKDEVQRVYSTLLTRVHHKPRTALVDELPVLIGAIDLPVYKRDRSSSPSVRCNDGLHCHALVLVPPVSRLKDSLIDHFECHHAAYVRPEKPIKRIDIRLVTETYDRALDYLLKTILRERLSYDDAIIVLPRAKAELR